jgi:hypothetical protein
MRWVRGTLGWILSIGAAIVALFFWLTLENNPPLGFIFSAICATVFAIYINPLASGRLPGASSIKVRSGILALMIVGWFAGLATVFGWYTWEALKAMVLFFSG